MALVLPVFKLKNIVYLRIFGPKGAELTGD
jgi:hypothetical protein